MTSEQRNELLRCAAQADAHGHAERARWYRIWAETGRQIGRKPEAMGSQASLGRYAPEC